MTSAELGDLLERSGQPRIGGVATPEIIGEGCHQLTATGLSLKRSKYNAVRSVDADGVHWDSKAERRRWGELRFMVEAGLIIDLERQPRFPISVNGIVVGVYVGDFQYVRVADDELIVEDVKGVKTAIYKFKKKCIAAEYGITITEIKA